MAKKIRMNTGTLSKDLEELNSLYTKTEKNFKEMTESIQSLNTTWDGMAHDAFLTQYQNDRTQMESELKELTQFLKSVLFAKNEYEKCENNVESTVNAIRV